LSPIFLLSLLGMAFALVRRRTAVLFALLALVLTAVVFGFYVKTTNNYGGVCIVARWFLWLVPLWLVAMLPAADRLGAGRWGRRLGYFLLLLSAFSAQCAVWNPWRHPWLYTFLEYLSGPLY